MKMLLFVTTLLMGQNALAGDTFTMPADMDTLYMVQEFQLGEIKYEVPPMCPPGAQCERTQVATVIVPLIGCVDQLGPVTVVKSEERRKLVLTMTAFGVVNPRSSLARCNRRPTAKVKVYLGPGGAFNRDNVIVEVAQGMLDEVK